MENVYGGMKIQLNSNIRKIDSLGYHTVARSTDSEDSKGKFHLESKDSNSC